jgi:hypothetical protein
MKCVRCGTDNNLKDRTANHGKCSKCQHPFTFEPNSMGQVKFTDPFFAKALSDISGNNTLFFTVKQLAYLLERRSQKKYINATIATSGCSSILMGFISLILTSGNLIISISVAAIGIVASCFLAISLKARGSQNLIRENDVERWLESWSIHNGQIPQQLSPPATPQRISASNDPPDANREATNYSFDRLVVCDRPAVTQMLIANNFHFEHNCALLCISGYPEQIFDTTMQMLRRNPDLQVFAFHDCSPRGIKLVQELRDRREWFAGTGTKIIDLGLSPRQAMGAAKQKLVIRNSTQAAREASYLTVDFNLSPKELSWLKKGNYVELESFTPQKLITILQHGIASAQQMDDSGSDLAFVDGGSDGGFYTVDSFG